MRRVFLSHRYDEPNTELAKNVEMLVESHGLLAFTGDTLEGRQLTPALKAQIERGDALIALLTRRDQLQSGGWTTHPYCEAELQHARQKDKPAIAVIEKGVAVPPFEAGHEYVEFDAKDSLPAFLKLSKTIAGWKKRVGRTIRVQVLPAEAAAEIRGALHQCTCEYMLSTPTDDGNWQRARVKKEPHGLFFYLQVPDDSVMVEIRVQGPNKTWSSDSTSFYLPLELQATPGGGA